MKGFMWLSIHSLKWECSYFDEIFITGCTGSCQDDKSQCSRWWKFCQNDKISISVFGFFVGKCVFTLLQCSVVRQSQFIIDSSFVHHWMGNLSWWMDAINFQHAMIWLMHGVSKEFQPCNELFLPCLIKALQVEYIQPYWHNVMR